MKTAIYIRVSTEEQAREGYSISAQMQKLKAFCISQGWDVAGIYPDEGISAKDMERPKLQEMIKDIKSEKIECVLVYRLDRLTRSVLDLYKMLEVFEEHDCKFKSATEVYDTTTAMGRMFVTIVAALAQWERENMGERIAFGYAEKARQGKWPLNFAPLGYDWDKEDYILKVNNKEAGTVKLIYDLYEKAGMSQVAKRLNNDKKLTKEGNKWSDNTIMKVLRNPVYIGKIQWNGQVYKGLHDPILTVDKWQAAQDLIKSRRMKPGRAVSSRYIFSGKIICNGCGKSMVGSHTTTYYKGVRTDYLNYRCRERRFGRCTKYKNISENKLEKAFIEYIDNYDYVDYLQSVAEEGERELNKPTEPVDTEDLEKRLAKIEKRKKKWQYAWAEDDMEYEDFKKRMAEAKEEETEIRSQLELLTVEEKEKERINKEEIIEALTNIKENWYHLKKDEKKSLVQSIVERIHYNHRGNKLIITHVDFM